VAEEVENISVLLQILEDQVEVEYMMTLLVERVILLPLVLLKETREEMVSPVVISKEVEEVVPEAQVIHLQQVIMEELEYNLLLHLEIPLLQ
jgi:hypothetical protein